MERREEKERKRRKRKKEGKEEKGRDLFLIEGDGRVGRFRRRGHGI
jgi:hypothetical protein